MICLETAADSGLGAQTFNDVTLSGTVRSIASSDDTSAIGFKALASGTSRTYLSKARAP